MEIFQEYKSEFDKINHEIQIKLEQNEFVKIQREIEEMEEIVRFFDDF